MTIKAIETVYNGYRFRSRLEARWAVFFDVLGVKYEYERQGFDLDEAGWYLPDFYLPGEKCWIEVKGQYPSPAEEKKAVHLAWGTGEPVVIFDGSDFQPPDIIGSVGMIGHQYNPDQPDDEDDDGIAYWTECKLNGLVLVQHLKPREGMPCCHSGSNALVGAYLAARQARFEHGERRA